MQDAPASPSGAAWKDRLAPAVHTVRAGVTRMDLVFIVAAIAFFAVSLAYVRGCDRL